MFSPSTDRLRLATCALLALVLISLTHCRKENGPDLVCTGARVGVYPLDLLGASNAEDLPLDQAITLNFSQEIDPATTDAGIVLRSSDGSAVPCTTVVDGNGLGVTLAPTGGLRPSQGYTLNVGEALKSTAGRNCKPLQLSFKTRAAQLQVVSATVNGQDLISNAPRDVAPNMEIRVRFDQPLNPATVSSSNVLIFLPGQPAPSTQLTLADHDSTVVLVSTQPLRDFSRYNLFLGGSIEGPAGYTFGGLTKFFYTALDPTPKFPLLSDDELLDLVQRQTFRYFWDFGHPNSGMARERNTSGDVVTTGGTGFGVMATVAAVERGFITRTEAVERWQKIVDFLTNDASRYHGAFPHWINGSTGATFPFSPLDNGADLVETAFLMQGLLTVRQYLNDGNPAEQQLKADIQALWEGVEWDWFTRGGQKVLYWHWSPDNQWAMNLPIRGYNEGLIVYFLAACSPTHPITPDVYHQGWANNGSIANGNSYYNIQLPLGYAYGGPLFFAHYSFLGLDPRQLKDNYGTYWTQNRNHSLINHAYCADNPQNKVGYSEQCWGLTASDNQSGYSAHSPTNDLGVISPTAALSSMPYTPDESLAAMRFFYYQLGDRLWGNYGFYDAFNPTVGWYATSTLAIDQGPIVVMLENYRSGKLWDLFMSSPEVAVGANALGFTY